MSHVKLPDADLAVYAARRAAARRNDLQAVSRMLSMMVPGWMAHAAIMVRAADRGWPIQGVTERHHWALRRGVQLGLVDCDGDRFRPVDPDLGPLHAPRGDRSCRPARSDAPRQRAPLFDYAVPPALGTTMTIQRGVLIELLAVEPYVRKRDGAASFVLTWRSADGRICTTGLRCQSVNWVSEGGNV